MMPMESLGQHLISLDDLPLSTGWAIVLGQACK